VRSDARAIAHIFDSGLAAALSDGNVMTPRINKRVKNVDRNSGFKGHQLVTGVSAINCIGAMAYLY